MFGLNQDFPLLLSSVLEHGAANFGDVPVVSVNRDEHVRLDYRTCAARARRLASGLRRLGFGLDKMAGSLAWNSHRHLELFYGVTGLGAVLHTANPRLPPAQICYTINFTGYRHIVHRSRYDRAGGKPGAAADDGAAVRRHGTARRRCRRPASGM